MTLLYGEEWRVWAAVPWKIPDKKTSGSLQRNYGWAPVDASLMRSTP